MSLEYNQVTPAVHQKLVEICGSEGVLTSESNKLGRYSHDAVAEVKYAHNPEVVVIPTDARQIAEIMKLATRERIPVTPRGAGSGLSGGAVPLYGGILLSLERMDHILEIDAQNLMAVVEPGVVTRELDEAAMNHGLFFAGYPMSEEFCTVGGNVAENAGGGRAIKYGVTGRYVTGLEVVLPTGEILTLGGKRLKDVTGYNLIGLLTGSEGTLAVITKITIRLLPRPTKRVTIAALFQSAESAVRVLSKLATAGSLVPTSAELMDRPSLHETCEALEETLPYEQSDAMMLFEVDGNNEDQVSSDAKVIEELCRAEQVVGVFRATTQAESERFWKIRKRAAIILIRGRLRQSIEDVVVPVAAIPQFLNGLREIERRFDISIPCIGHAGDGNLHATPRINPEWSIEEWEEREPEILGALYRMVRELGGTLSGEHGIGHKRKGYLPLVMDAAEIDLLRRVKEAFDPAGILNPGKIFDCSRAERTR